MSQPNPGDAHKNGRKNFLNITLQIGKEGETRYASSGKPYAQARAFYSQGKDKFDEFLPSIWFKVMVFGEVGKEIDSTPALLALGSARKGDKIEARGHIGYEEWTLEGGEKRSNLVLYATDVKMVENGGPVEGEEPQP
jgi:hypothetical protein